MHALKSAHLRVIAYVVLHFRECLLHRKCLVSVLVP